MFLDQPCTPGLQAEIGSADARHLALILRMKPGERIVVVSQKVAWDAELVEVSGRRAVARIIEPALTASPEPPVEVAVLQAVPKGTKMDDVVEKVVELGAARIVPVRCARSYGGDSEHKIDRWRRIARAAAQQSQRLIVPTVEESMNFDDALRRFAATSHVILAHERAPKGSLALALQRDAQRALAIVIGPEGSFTDAELKLATDAGSDLVSLGPTILRTETAAAATLAAIAALRGWL